MPTHKLPPLLHKKHHIPLLHTPHTNQHNATTHPHPHLDKQLHTSHLYSEIPRGFGPIYPIPRFGFIYKGKQFEKTGILDIKCHTKKDKN